MTPQQAKQLMDTVTRLEREVDVLKSFLDLRGGKFEETIRDIVLFDVDNTSLTTETKNIVDSRGDTASFSVAKTPTKYARAYFRGQVYNVALYAIA